MGRARRFKVNIVNAGLGQSLAEVLRAGPFLGADTQEQHFDLLVECCRVLKVAPTGGFRVECPASPAAAATESADIRELVKVRKGGPKGLHATHGKACHGAVVAT